MHGRIVRIVVSAALLALAASSCGGGLSKDEYIQQADQRCEQANQDLRALGAPRSEAELREFSSKAKPIMEDFVADLRELEPPEEQQRLVNKMISGFEEQTALLPDLTNAVAGKNAEKLQEVGAKLVGSVAESNKAAKDYGLETCSSGPLSVAGT